MLIESDAVGSLYVVPVGVYPEVRRWFAFSYVLLLLAEGAMPQVDNISALAVEIVAYLQRFPCHVAGECCCRLDVPAALVSGCGEAGFRAWVFRFPGVLRYLFAS